MAQQNSDSSLRFLKYLKFSVKSWQLLKVGFPWISEVCDIWDVQEPLGHPWTLISIGSDWRPSAFPRLFGHGLHPQSFGSSTRQGWNGITPSLREMSEMNWNDPCHSRHISKEYNFSVGCFCFFQIFSSRIWGKQGQVRCARSGHCATSDRLGQDGRALDWSSPAGPKSDAQGGLPLGYGSKMIVISFGIIGKYQLISTDINWSWSCT